MKRHYSPDQDNLFIIDAIESLEGFEVAIGGAPATGRLPARIIRKEEITIGVLGGANAARGVSALLDSDVYSDSRDIDESMAVEDRDVVLVPRGYHPVVVPHGYQSYYFNVMAGPKRVWHFHNDPAHEWILSAA
jgi:5-deoxy-D-glucuronate isomerase